MAKTATYGAILGFLNAQAYARPAEDNGNYSLVFQGNGDKRNVLSAWNRCPNAEVLFQHWDVVGYTQRLTFKKLDNGLWNIIGGDHRGSCDRKYLSVPHRCEHNKPDWWVKDDGSGRQQWQIEKNGDGYKFTIPRGRQAGCGNNTLYMREGINNVELGPHANSKWNRIEINDFHHVPDVILPEHVQIYALGMGEDENNELSFSNSCNCDQVLMTTPENFTLDSRLTLRRVAGDPAVFNIVQGNRKCPKKFISVKEDCDVNLVDLWGNDDWSGKQRFRAHKVEGKEDVYYLKAGGRPGCKDVYLTTEPNNGTLILGDEWNTINAWFRIQVYQGLQVQPITWSSEVFFGHINGGDNVFGQQFHKCLKQPKFGEKIQDNFHPIWYFKPVDGYTNVFNIISRTRCGGRRFLSVHGECENHHIDLWGRDDRSGKQQWIIFKVEDGVYRLRAGGRKNCPWAHLSWGANGNGESRLHLWNSARTNRQYFKIAASGWEDSIVTHHCVHINQFGSVTGKNRLALENTGDRKCNESPLLNDPTTDFTTNEQRWHLRYINKKHNTFSIISIHNNCHKRFLTASDDCANPGLSFENRDDGSGRQHWTVRRVPENDGRFYFEANIACDNAILSSHPVSGDLSLVAALHNDDQWFGFQRCWRPVRPIRPPKCSRLITLNTANHERFAGLSRDCDDNVARFVRGGDVDNEKSQANWEVIPVEGKRNTFKFKISPKRLDCDAKWLSVYSACENFEVFTSEAVDPSGASEWVIEHVEEEGAHGYNIKSNGRAHCDQDFYLSKNVEENILELSEIKETIDQRFGIGGGSCTIPEDEVFDRSGCRNLFSLNPGLGRDILAFRQDKCYQENFLIAKEDQHESLKFGTSMRFVPIKHQKNTYMIAFKGPNNVCSETILSVEDNCRKRNTKFVHSDSKTGNEYWVVEHIRKQGEVFALRNVGRANCKDNQGKYLHTHHKNPFALLGNNNKNRNAWWSIPQCQEHHLENVGIPECAKIVNTGKLDGRDHLSFQKDGCHPRTFVTRDKTEKRAYGFKMIPIADKPGVYNIVAQRSENCKRIYLSAASCFCQNYVDFWDRDDGSGRQQWAVVAVGDRYVIRAFGRDARAYLSTDKFGEQLHLWTENDNSGRQLWSFKHCQEPEQPEIPDDSDEGTFWYTHPKWNEWNFGTSWPGLPCNYPNAQKGWRFWWNQRMRPRDFDVKNFNFNTNFRFWLQLVRDEQWINCLDKKAGSRCRPSIDAGSNLAFRGEGEGQVWEWIQLNDNKGWGLIRLAGTHLYLAPQASACSSNQNSVQVRSGSRVGLQLNASFNALWFFTNRRIRHSSGNWLKVNDKHRLVIGKRRGGLRSIFRMYGPDQSPLENFPCVTGCAEESYYTDDLESPYDDGTEDGEGNDTTCLADGEVVECDADQEVAEEEEVEEPETETPTEGVEQCASHPLFAFLDPISRDILCRTVQGESSAQEEVEEMTESGAGDMTSEEVEELITEEPELENLPGEIREELEPAVCCILVPNENGIPQTTENAAPNAAAAKDGIDEVLALAKKVQELLDELSPGEDLNAQLPGLDLPTIQATLDVFKNAPTDATGQDLDNPNILPSQKAILDLLKNAIVALETAEDCYVTLDPEDIPGSKTIDFPTGPGPIGPVIKTITTPHRVYYKNFNKVPVPAATIVTLQENMRDRLDDFKKALGKMNEFGLGVELGQPIRVLENRIDRLLQPNAKKQLRLIRKIISRIMRLINAAASKNNLFDNEEFVAEYNVASDNLYRKNAHISVNCFAIFAQAKLLLFRTTFERRVLNRDTLPPRYRNNLPEADADRMTELITLMREGEKESAEQYLPAQTERILEYHDLCRKNFRHLLKAQRAAKKAGENPKCNAFNFRRSYCNTEGDWYFTNFLMTI